MFKIFKQLIEDINQLPEPQQNHSVEVASAVLLCEVMRADGLLHQEEITHIKQALLKQFPNLAEQIEEIIEQAIALSENATDFYQFTSIINQAFSHEKRIEMVSMLWQLALSDGELVSIEEHTIRKIADLLHLRQSEYIQAKNTIL